eukprot:746940-Hanusia_phi.AAC.1
MFRCSFKEEGGEYCCRRKGTRRTSSLPPTAGLGLVQSKAAEDHMMDSIKQHKVQIFSKSYCPYCKNSKALFENIGVQYHADELDLIPNGSEIQAVSCSTLSFALFSPPCQELAKLTGQRTVPNIFIDGKHLGGNDGAYCVKALESGKLAALLKDAGQSARARRRTHRALAGQQGSRISQSLPKEDERQRGVEEVKVTSTVRKVKKENTSAPACLQCKKIQTMTARIILEISTFTCPSRLGLSYDVELTCRIANRILSFSSGGRVDRPAVRALFLCSTLSSPSTCWRSAGGDEQAGFHHRELSDAAKPVSLWVFDCMQQSSGVPAMSGRNSPSSPSHLCILTPRNAGLRACCCHVRASP